MLADEIRAVIKQMPLVQQKIINTTVTGIHALCALADAVGQEQMLGAISIALVGAEYQDAEDAAESATRD